MRIDSPLCCLCRGCRTQQRTALSSSRLQSHAGFGHSRACTIEHTEWTLRTKLNSEPILPTFPTPSTAPGTMWMPFSREGKTKSREKSEALLRKSPWQAPCHTTQQLGNPTLKRLATGKARKMCLLSRFTMFSKANRSTEAQNVLGWKGS